MDFACPRLPPAGWAAFSILKKPRYWTRLASRLDVDQGRSFLDGQPLRVLPPHQRAAVLSRNRNISLLQSILCFPVRIRRTSLPSSTHHHRCANQSAPNTPEPPTITGGLGRPELRPWTVATQGSWYSVANWDRCRSTTRNRHRSADREGPTRRGN